MCAPYVHKWHGTNDNKPSPHSPPKRSLGRVTLLCQHCAHAPHSSAQLTWAGLNQVTGTKQAVTHCESMTCVRYESHTLLCRCLHLAHPNLIKRKCIQVPPSFSSAGTPTALHAHCYLRPLCTRSHHITWKEASKQGAKRSGLPDC
jgi:hypothetical protein